MASHFSRAFGFGENRRGTAAVEFAMLFPIMLVLYIGVIDLTRGVIASRKLNLLARTVADLVSQQPTAYPVPMTTLTNIFGAASSVMQPYDPASIKLTVSAVDVKYNTNTNTCCDAMVRWSVTQNGLQRGCSPALARAADGVRATQTNFPTSLINANANQGYTYATGAVSYVIVADAYYTYTPFFFQAFSWFAPGMGKISFMVPRSPGGPVTISDPSTLTAPLSGTVCFS